LKNRGVQDVCNGLKGLPDAINTVLELATFKPAFCT
jgi:transposase-like protein